MLVNEFFFFCSCMVQKRLVISLWEIFFKCVINEQIDMKKVDLDVLKPWIEKRVTEILTFEDDVVIEFIYNSLSEKQVSF